MTTCYEAFVPRLGLIRGRDEDSSPHGNLHDVIVLSYAHLKRSFTPESGAHANYNGLNTGA